MGSPCRFRLFREASGKVSCALFWTTFESDVGARRGGLACQYLYGEAYRSLNASRAGFKFLKVSFKWCAKSAICIGGAIGTFVRLDYHRMCRPRLFHASPRKGGELQDYYCCPAAGVDPEVYLILDTAVMLHHSSSVENIDTTSSCSARTVSEVMSIVIE